MGTYSQIDIVKVLRLKQITLFSLSDLARLLHSKNTQTLYKQVERLVAKQLIKQLTKGTYQFSFSSVDDFTLANFLCRPSYVSLESALSLYGIITGFPYQVTSLTTRKPCMYTIENKEFSYSRIAPQLFWGYEKKEDYLLAEKEKALADYLYFYSKGLRGAVWDEFDVSQVDPKKFRAFVRRFHNDTMEKVMEKIL